MALLMGLIVIVIKMRKSTTVNIFHQRMPRGKKSKKTSEKPIRKKSMKIKKGKRKLTPRLRQKRRKRHNKMSKKECTRLLTHHMSKIKQTCDPKVVVASGIVGGPS